MILQALEKTEQDLISAAIEDPHRFSLEEYRARMMSRLGDEERNRIFFEALQFAHDLHAGQRRKSGAPYISHPCAVAEILAREMHIRDSFLLAGALLHDVVEDIPTITMDDIEERFGEAVAELVDGCTKLTRRHLDRATLKDLTHSKIFLSASRRLGVLVIKLADRLHNLRTLHYLSQSKRQRIAQETVEVYAPIAAKFNIFPVKRELYQLALTYLYPRRSKRIMQTNQAMRKSPVVAEIEAKLRQVLSERGMPVTVRTRSKGLGSYYDHLKRSLEISNAENHIDFAVILESDDILDCYAALGQVSLTFASIPRTLRDFVANPKNNGYRSLHIRIHLGGQNYLVKIRTPEMDHWATYGILSAWDTGKQLDDDHWHEISELLRSIGEYGGAGPQRKALIRLSETEEIFVYSPDGDIYYLPKGSVVLDFAYRIHSELGEFCQGAYVNAEWSEPTRPLKDGDIVGVITASEHFDADPDIEQLCKTPKARTSINKHLQQKRRHYARDIGEQILSQELARHGIPSEVLDSENTRLMLEILNIKDINELFIRLGQDLTSPHLVLFYLESPHWGKDRGHQHNSMPRLADEQTVVRVSELDKAIHKFARCCNPYPGQNNVVATLSERGLTFHHKSCKDPQDRHGLEPQQLLDVEWERDAAWPHPLSFHLDIHQETPMSLLRSLVKLPSSIHIHRIEGSVNRHDQSMVHMRVRFMDFEGARQFFESLPNEKIIIEDYRREEGPRQLGTEIAVKGGDRG